MIVKIGWSTCIGFVALYLVNCSCRGVDSISRSEFYLFKQTKVLKRYDGMNSEQVENILNYRNR